MILHGKEEYVRDEEYIMVLKDSGVMPKHGYIIIEVYRSHTLIFT